MQKCASLLRRMLVVLFHKVILQIGGFGQLDLSCRYFFSIVVISHDRHPGQKINLTFCLCLIGIKVVNLHMTSRICIASVRPDLFGGPFIRLVPFINLRRRVLMFSFMREHPLLSSIVQDLSILPHIPRISPWGFVIDYKVVIVVLVQ